MRLDNLGNEDKQKLKSGDIKLLKTILETEYELVKEDLIYCTIDRYEEIRGKAKTLLSIIKLLP